MLACLDMAGADFKLLRICQVYQQGSLSPCVCVCVCASACILAALLAALLAWTERAHVS